MSCSAVNCTNRAPIFKMYRFPKDPSIRMVWETRVKRANWKPNENSRLCEEHFEEDHFLFGVDGRKQKLKKGAVPTVFSYMTKPLPKPRKSRNLDQDCPGSNDHRCHRIMDHEYFQTNPDSSGKNVRQSTIFEASIPQEADQIVVLEGLDEEDIEMNYSVEVHNICHNCHTFENEAKMWNTKFKKHAESIKILRQKLRMGKQTIQRMQKRVRVMTARLHQAHVGSSSTFREDQISCMERQSLTTSTSDHGLRWTNKSVKQGLKLRFACGQSGYDALLKEKFPLPSIRTLQRRTQNIDFESGILHDVFALMSLKSECMAPQDKLCCLLLDEMALTSGKFYDPSSDSLVGHVTLPNHSGDACKALVVMLGGIATRWKQTVAYYYTGNSTNGVVYADIIKKVIHEASKIGLKVVAVTSDMGAPNQAMWKEFGVNVGRDSTWTTSIPNPSWEGEALTFLADRPHLLKNIRASLGNENEFRIPEDIRIKANLPCGNVSLKHVKDLVELDSKNELRLVPKLDMKTLDPSHFDKMKVGAALRVLDHATAHALRYCVEYHGFPQECLVTAWFIDKIRTWFDIVCSRSATMALSKCNGQKHHEAIHLLREVKDIFMRMEIVGRSGKISWKPIQTGLVMTTMSILDLQDYLLNEEGFDLILCSRFSQDALENLFSVVRSKNPTPNSREFKFYLRAIALAQFMTEKKNSNYQYDEGEFLADFLDMPKLANTTKPAATLFLFDDILNSNTPIHKTDSDILEYVSGWVIQRVFKHSKSCKGCEVEWIRSTVPGNACNFIKYKDYTGESLMYPSEWAMEQVFRPAETLFRQGLAQGLMKKGQQIRSLIGSFSSVNNPASVATCDHEILPKILSRFFRLRIRSHCRQEKEKGDRMNKKRRSNQAMASKSQKMRLAVENIK